MEILGDGDVCIGCTASDSWKLKVEDIGTALASFTSTSAGTGGPSVALYLDSASPAGGDHCGYLTWYANNSVGASVSYGYMMVNCGDITSASENANWYLYLQMNGSHNLAMYVSDMGAVNGDLPYSEYDDYDDRTQIELAIKDPSAVHRDIRDDLFLFHPDHRHGERPMLNYSTALVLWAGGIYQNHHHINDIEARVDGLWEEAHQTRDRLSDLETQAQDYGVKVLDICDQLKELRAENVELKKQLAELAAAA